MPALVIIGAVLALAIIISRTNITLDREKYRHEEALKQMEYDHQLERLRGTKP